jgi:glucosamine 6-phosphate synthetase-like amidotransferase/phosphosugar isomerase protein
MITAFPNQSDSAEANMTATKIETTEAQGLPAYSNSDTGATLMEEKQAFVTLSRLGIFTRLTRDSPQIVEHCTKHGPSQTPNLDRQLQSPRNREFVHGLITALDQAVQEGHCTECAIQKMAELVTAYAQDMKAQKKQGHWSKEEKRALKKELKEVGKRVKSTVKAMKRARKA